MQVRFRSPVLALLLMLLPATLVLGGCIQRYRDFGNGRDATADARTADRGEGPDSRDADVSSADAEIAMPRDASDGDAHDTSGDEPADAVDLQLDAGLAEADTGDADTAPDAPSPVCGDGKCEPPENSLHCCQDCGCGCGEECMGGECSFIACVGKQCGDSGCGFDCTNTCPGCDCEDNKCKCGPACGDGQCAGQETCSTCWEDCPCQLDEDCLVDTCGSCAAHCSEKEVVCGELYPGCICGTCDCGFECTGSACSSVLCLGKECGPDGCGGECGGCVLPEKCFDGICKECDDGNDVDWDGCNDGKIVEFRLNTVTQGTQSAPAAAGLKDGKFMVAWGSDGPGCTKEDVMARTFGPNGTGFGGNEFKVNETTAGFQTDPALAHLGDDRAVVVWESGPDPSTADVFGQIRHVTDQKNEGEFKVNSLASAPPFRGNPAVSVFAGGQFCVAWNTDNLTGTNAEIYWRKFDSQAEPQATEIQVNTYTTSWQQRPAVRACDVDAALVLWDSKGQDGSGYGVYGRFIGFSGDPAGAAFQVSSHTANDQDGPAVAPLTGCGTLAVWRSQDQDGSFSGVYGQRLLADGNTEDFEFRVNDFVTGHQRAPAAASLEDGTVLVAWESCPTTETGQDGSGCGVFRKVFAPDGSLLASEYQVNACWQGDQGAPAVATAGNAFIVVWQGDAPEGGGTDIFAVRFDSTGKKLCSGNGCS